MTRLHLLDSAILLLALAAPAAAQQRQEPSIAAALQENIQRAGINTHCYEFAPIHEEEILRTKTNRVPGTSTPELVPLAQVKHLYLLPPKLKEYLRKMDR